MNLLHIWRRLYFCCNFLQFAFIHCSIVVVAKFSSGLFQSLVNVCAEGHLSDRMFISMVLECLAKEDWVSGGTATTISACDCESEIDSSGSHSVVDMVRFKNRFGQVLKCLDEQIYLDDPPICRSSSLKKILLSAYNSFRELSFWFFYVFDLKMTIPRHSYAKYPLALMLRTMLEITSDARYMLVATPEEIDSFVSIMYKSFASEQELEAFLLSPEREWNAKLKGKISARVKSCLGEDYQHLYFQLCKLSHFEFVGASIEIAAENEEFAFIKTSVSHVLKLLQALVSTLQQSSEFVELSNDCKPQIESLLIELESWTDKKPSIGEEDGRD